MYFLTKSVRGIIQYDQATKTRFARGFPVDCQRETAEAVIQFLAAQQPILPLSTCVSVVIGRFTKLA